MLCTVYVQCTYPYTYHLYLLRIVKKAKLSDPRKKLHDFEKLHWLRKVWIKVSCRALQTLTLFKTKNCSFRYPV